ncbi:uncharacterized protein LOC115599570 [Calypte anna]|uniref:uncharacterized protein LOC115599570 n=1 Tax=Calypte anna TaxID=9244 RepID=UPI0011C41141|nr:uncharacterized protein LOC115599570 [Calypte anna]
MAAAGRAPHRSAPPAAAAHKAGPARLRLQPQPRSGLPPSTRRRRCRRLKVSEGWPRWTPAPSPPRLCGDTPLGDTRVSPGHGRDPPGVPKLCLSPSATNRSSPDRPEGDTCRVTADDSTHRNTVWPPGVYLMPPPGTPCATLRLVADADTVPGMAVALRKGFTTWNTPASLRNTTTWIPLRGGCARDWLGVAAVIHGGRSRMRKTGDFCHILPLFAQWGLGPCTDVFPDVKSCIVAFKPHPSWRLAGAWLLAWRSLPTAGNDWKNL